MSNIKPHDQITKINKLYSSNLNQYGTTSKSVGWKDDHGQLLRFDKLCQVLNQTDKEESLSISINDFGCGYAAMYQYLKKLNSIRIQKYYGYDISQKMLAAAKEYTGKDAKVNLIKAESVLFSADYTFISGTFNVKFETSDAEWTKFILNHIDLIAEKSLKGFSFNLLSTYVDWKENHLFYGDPLYFFNYCKKNISPYVSLLHDYPLYEWTILVKMGLY